MQGIFPRQLCVAVGAMLAITLALLATPDRGIASTFQILYSFTGAADGSDPKAIVVGNNGVLYGTTKFGDLTESGCQPTCGVVFSLTPPAIAGGSWTDATINAFDDTNGANPEGSLLLGPNGGIFGTTSFGGAPGAFNSGTVYHLAPPASPGGAWTESILHSFNLLYPLKGENPQDGLAAANGSLYGTDVGQFASIIYQLTPPTTGSGHWTETVLFSFPANGSSDGELIADASGTLYGGASDGGTHHGIIYTLIPPATPGGSWTFAPIYGFGGAPDGSGPGKLLFGANGVLYGETGSGGTSKACANGCGTVFQLTPPTVQGGAWTETVLYSFNGTTDGSFPGGGLVAGPNGSLYGMTPSQPGGDGAVFQLSPPTVSGGTWTFTSLHSFTGTPDGQFPTSLTIDQTTGTLYGTTLIGGADNMGTVFSVQP